MRNSLAQPMPGIEVEILSGLLGIPGSADYASIHINYRQRRFPYDAHVQPFAAIILRDAAGPSRENRIG
jgi:hypothetical protein